MATPRSTYCAIRNANVISAQAAAVFDVCVVSMSACLIPHLANPETPERIWITMPKTPDAKANSNTGHCHPFAKCGWLDVSILMGFYQAVRSGQCRVPLDCINVVPPPRSMNLPENQCDRFKFGVRPF
jgi:hypothetical protein